jgi:hypothetical protein
MRDSARTMPVDRDAEAVTALRIWHCKYQSLAGVADYINLTTLVVASYPDGDLVPVASLGRLNYLRILHLPNVHDLTPLSGLTQLRTIRLSTLPSWDSSGKTTTVESLRPLADIPALAHVELIGVRPADLSLRDLEAAPRLVSVRASKLPMAEMARFYRATGVSDALAPGPEVEDWN